MTDKEPLYFFSFFQHKTSTEIPNFEAIAFHISVNVIRSLGKRKSSEYAGSGLQYKNKKNVKLQLLMTCEKTVLSLHHFQ